MTTFEEWQGIPQCVEGETRVNTDPAFPLGTYVCQGGQWVLAGEGAVTPEGEAPGAEPKTISCPTGQHMEYDAWDTELQYPFCVSDTATPPPGGETPGAVAGLGAPGEDYYPVGSPEWMEERYTRWPGYGTAMGLFGRQQLAPFEQYLRSMYEPLSSLYDISGEMAMQGFGQYAPGGMFSQWAPQYAQNPFSMYGQAQGMMGDVFNMPYEQRGEAGLHYGGGSLSDLLMMALRPQLGKQTARSLVGRLPAAQEQWVTQYPGWTAGAGQPSFLDYIREKYNLEQFI